MNGDNAMQRIVFRCTDETYGLPVPPMPDGAVVIVFQDGIAEVGRYEGPRPPENPWPIFSHPVNVEALRAEALAAIRQVVGETRDGSRDDFHMSGAVGGQGSLEERSPVRNRGFLYAD